MKFGRKPPVHNRRTMRCALALAPALDALGPPPKEANDYVSAVYRAVGNDNWGMLGNDSVGDCTCADSGHHVMLTSANGGQIVVPTTEQVLAMYRSISGWDGVPDSPSDTGCAETDVCNYMQTTGLAGVRSSGSAMVDPANLDHIRWTVQIFGACRLGIVVGQDSVQQATSGQAWNAVTTDPNAGGHDVPVVHYDATYAYAVTWGRLQPISWSLMANPAFLEEAHCELYPDFCTSGGTAPNGFDLQQLTADLALVA